MSPEKGAELVKALAGHFLFFMPRGSCEILLCPLRLETTYSSLPSPPAPLRFSLLAAPQLRHSGSAPGWVGELWGSAEGAELAEIVINPWMAFKERLFHVVPHIRTSGMVQNCPSQSSQFHVPLSPTEKTSEPLTQPSPSQLSMFTLFFCFPSF